MTDQPRPVLTPDAAAERLLEVLLRGWADLLDKPDVELLKILAAALQEQRGALPVGHVCGQTCCSGWHNPACGSDDEQLNPDLFK